jgi:hypothetical protein
MGNPWHFAIGNRTDVNRSKLLSEAMERGQPIWQFDTDVCALQSFEFMLSIIDEDVKAGFDAVVAPTGGPTGVVNAQAMDGHQIPAKLTTPLEIKGPLAGCWYMSTKGLLKLKPIGYQEATDRSITTMFCSFAPPAPTKDKPNPHFMTEDFDLAVRFREEGGRICIDPRLHVVHLEKRDIAVRGDL